MKRILFQEPKYLSATNNLRLLRVELSGSYTKIDFGYQATEDAKIRISKEVHLAIVNEEQKFKLTQAGNIPIAPKYFHCKTRVDWLFFSLYFEPVPVKCCDLNLMENKGVFNFYSIELDKKKLFEIK